MDDVNTGLTILGDAIGSVKTVEKLLGSSVQYLGNDLKNWPELRVKNVGKIFEKFQKKLGEKIQNDGAVHPKVLKVVLNEGSFCDNELVTEYFGGILASSRNDISRDDRGVSYAALVSSLPTYQILSHYIFYKAIKALFNGRIELDVSSFKDRKMLETYIPINSYNQAINFDEKEDVLVILPFVMSGLVRENLIERDFEIFSGEKIVYCGGKGVVFCPTALGVELFHWAHGKGNVPTTDFLQTNCEFSFETEIQIPADMKSVATALDQARQIMERFKPTF
jgi:hypothetical protein